MSENKLEEIKKKLFQIYENFGLDMENMEEYEIDRMVDFYSKNKNQLEQDLKKSSQAKKKSLK
jgi:hypothetical protein